MIQTLEELRPLLLLNRLRLRAALRSRIRQLSTIRGVLFVVTIAVFIVFIRSTFVRYAAEEEYVVALNSSDSTGWFAVGLVVACLMTIFTSTGPSLHFSMAEMNILYSAPISRSSLVVNKVLSYILGAVLSALVMVVLLPKTGLNRGVVFTAIVLSLLFVQLASAVVGMGAIVLKRRWRFLPDRKQILLLYLPVALGLIVIAAYSLASVGSSQGDIDGPVQVLVNWGRESAIVAVLFSPFVLFAELYAVPESISAYVLRVLLSMLVLCVFVFVLVRLDERLRDETSASSLIAHQRWEKILKTGSVLQGSTGKLRSRSAPKRFGNAVTLAWCQCLRLFRTAPSIAYGLPCLALLAGVLLGFNAASVTESRLFFPVLFFLFVFMLPKTLTFDFRGVPDSIEKLINLPVSSRSICIGQLMTPVICASVLQWLMMLGALPFVSYKTAMALLGLAVLALPFNFLLYATENTLFLLVPSRLVPVGRVDFDFLGRTLLEFLLKCAVLVLALACVLITGWALWMISPDSWVPALIAMLLVLLAEILLALFAVTFAYNKFDTEAIGRSS